MERMARQVRNGRYLFLPNGSHMAMYDDQKAYFDGLIRFVRDVDAGERRGRRPRRSGPRASSCEAASSRSRRSGRTRRCPRRSAAERRTGPISVWTCVGFVTPGTPRRRVASNVSGDLGTWYSSSNRDPVGSGRHNGARKFGYELRRRDRPADLRRSAEGVVLQADERAHLERGGSGTGATAWSSAPTTGRPVSVRPHRRSNGVAATWAVGRRVSGRDFRAPAVQPVTSRAGMHPPRSRSCTS